MAKQTKTELWQPLSEKQTALVKGGMAHKNYYKGPIPKHPGHYRG